MILRKGGNILKKKIVGIFLCMLLITTYVLPVVVSKNIVKFDEPNVLDKVDQKQDQMDNFVILFNDMYFAQSFKPSLPKLTKIILLIGADHDGTTITVSIRDDLYGADLITKTISANDINPEHTWVWFSIDFQDIKVNPGSPYYIIVTSNDNDTSIDYSAWGYSLNDLYLYGNIFYRYVDEYWVSNSENDFCFKTYGTRSKSKELNNMLEKFPMLYQLFQELIDKIENLRKILL